MWRSPNLVSACMLCHRPMKFQITAQSDFFDSSSLLYNRRNETLYTCVPSQFIGVSSWSLCPVNWTQCYRTTRTTRNWRRLYPKQRSIDKQLWFVSTRPNPPDCCFGLRQFCVVRQCDSGIVYNWGVICQKGLCSIRNTLNRSPFDR